MSILVLSMNKKKVTTMFALTRPPISKNKNKKGPLHFKLNFTLTIKINLN